MTRLPRLALGFVALALVPLLAQEVTTLPFENQADRDAWRHLTALLDGTRLTVDWDGVSLKDALKDVSRRTRLNILVAATAKEREEEPVTRKLTEVRLRTILGLFHDSHGIVFQHRHGVLWATTEADALKQAMVLAVHDVRDLLYSPPDFPAPVGLGIRPGPPVEAETEEAREEKSPDFLLDLVKSTTGEKLWEVEGSSIQIHKGQIFVRHAPHVQAKVRSVIGLLRGSF